MRTTLVTTIFALALTISLNAQSKELKQLARWMEGNYSSAAQAARDTNYFDIRLHIKRVWHNRPGYWFYVEQAVAAAQARPYRQRFYHLFQRADGTFESEVYTVDNPLRLAGAWKNTKLLAGITPDSLTLRAGCSVVLTLENGRFVGSTVGTGCASDLRGASHATSEVTISASEMRSWDRGYNAAGEQVWGATEGPYIFVKGK